jgi:predicted DNA-binding transcriptional regulator AlpA
MVSGSDEYLNSIPVKTSDQRSEMAAIKLDLVGSFEAAELLGISRAALWERRGRHDNFPPPVADLRCGPVWFRWQIHDYAAEERRLGRRGWHGLRSLRRPQS